MTGLTLTRLRTPGSYQIAGTGLGIRRGRTGAFRLERMDLPAYRWATHAGLAGIWFDRRQDLLHAVAAAAAIRPIPETHAPAAGHVRLIRQTDGSHVTADGDYEVRPIPAPRRRPHARWRIINVRAGWPHTTVDVVGTLRQAQLTIAENRAKDIHPPRPHT